MLLFFLFNKEGTLLGVQPLLAHYLTRIAV
jgi:hypothetical protein